MKTVLDTLLLIVSIAFVLDCIFTGAIRKALAPVNGAMVNALAVVLVFDSAFGVIKESWHEETSHGSGAALPPCLRGHARL